MHMVNIMQQIPKNFLFYFIGKAVLTGSDKIKTYFHYYSHDYEL